MLDVLVVAPLANVTMIFQALTPRVAGDRAADSATANISTEGRQRRPVPYVANVELLHADAQSRQWAKQF
jgi:hypothetical protein